MKKKFSATLALSCFVLFSFAKANGYFLTYEDLNYLSENSKNKILSAKTLYGQGATEKYFQFQMQENGLINLVEIKNPTSNSLGLTFKYNPQNTLKPMVSWKDTENGIEGNQISTLSGNYINQTGTKLSLSEDETKNMEVNILAFANAGGKVDDINANFVGNVINLVDNPTNLEVNLSIPYGAVVNFGDGKNLSEIGNIQGVFIANEVIGFDEAGGAAIANLEGHIKNINADFIGNNVQGSAPVGGAILNMAFSDNITTQIDEIKGNFIANSAVQKFESTSDKSVQAQGQSTSSVFFGGGAITNMGGVINNISADFIANQAIGLEQIAGGAINNTQGIIKEISGNFYNNSAMGPLATGGAISNNGSYDYYIYTDKETRVNSSDSSQKNIYRITGEFVENSADSMKYGGAAQGGAISNIDGEIGEIDAKFERNATSGVESFGGAIFNIGKIDKINGKFNNNVAFAFDDAPSPVASYAAVDIVAGAMGGAILNGGEVEEINADFTQNQAISSGTAIGGAVANWGGVINKIKGIFTKNSTQALNATGGAIANAGYIKEIEGKFEENTVKTFEQDLGQGAAENLQTKRDSGPSTRALGGALYNEDGSGKSADISRGRIDVVQADFINNSVQNSNGEAFGGAIYNAGEIETIQGTFAKNSTQALNSAGGAIANSGNITTIKGRFEDNIVKAEKETNISQNYVANSSSNSGGIGGALFNDGTGNQPISSKLISTNNSGIDLIQADFINNSVQNDGYALGGAIGNMGVINSINSNFDGNHVDSNKNLAFGGAILNIGHIDTINGTFENNYAKTEIGLAAGGAINNQGDISTIQGIFKNNYAEAKEGEAAGGAIYSSGDLTILADNSKTLFSGNYVKSLDVVENNAIYMSNADLTLNALNNGEIIFDDTINGNNSNNQNSNYYNIHVTGDDTGRVVLNNYIHNANITMDNTTLKLGSSDVLKDSVIEARSGLVDVRDGEYTNYNIKQIASGATTQVADVDSTTGNNVKYAVDIFLSDDKQISDTFTISDTSTGKINIGVVSVENQCADDKEYVLQIIKSSSTDAPELAYDSTKVLNEAKANMTDEDIIADGFALATTTTSNDSIKVRGLKDTFSEWAKFDKSEDKEFVFNNNSDYKIKQNLDLKGTNVTIKGSKNTLDINNTNLISNIENGKNINLENINVVNVQEINNDGNLNLKDASAEITKNVLSNQKGKITLDNSNLETKGTVVNQEITAENNSSLTISNTNDFRGNDVNLNTSTLNIPHLNLNGINFDNLNVADGVISINKVDVDLQNEKMGQITSTNSNIQNAQIDIKALNAVSDSNKNELQIAFLDKDADNITVNLENKEVLTPIRKYEAQYLKNDDKGFFKFKNLGGNSSKNYNTFNPAIMASSVATQLGGYLIQLNSYDEAFRNMDMYMLLSKKERQALRQQRLQIQQLNPDNKFKNKIASIQMNANYDERTDRFNNPAGWFRPYTTFESVPLKNGPKVNNTTYGSFFGTESKIYPLKNNWDIINGLYIGYNGSHQSYDNIDIYQNGGTLGAISMAYKDNFFTGLTLNTGANAGRANTMYGYDDFTTFMAGIASKTGYNFEFKNGKYIIQPNYLMSYSFINTFDYTSASGVKIDTNALHAIQIEPGIKFIANLKNNFQPYANVSFIWSILDKTNFSANDIALSELSIKPYVKYGIGIRKTHKDRLSGYFQTYLTHGGRNGVGLQAGLNFLVGR